MIRFCIVGILLSLVSCAPASISSYEFSLPSDPQLFWTATPATLESFVVAFVQNFDPKFANAFVASDLSVKNYSVHEVTLNRNAYFDTDGKPYRLTIFVAWTTNSSAETSFILMNEENTGSLDFPANTLAFALNTELIKALDAKFKRLPT
jgi:hypothetical protein